MKKRLMRANSLSLAVAAIAVTALLAVATFVTVSASEDVSPTDVGGQAVTENAEETEQSVEGEEGLTVQNPTENAEELFTAEGEAQPAQEPNESGGATVRSETVDLILSSQAYLPKRNGPGNKKFLDNHSYQGSYRSELTATEQQIYDGLYQTYVMDKKSYTEATKIIFSPAVPYTVIDSDPATDTLSINDLDDLHDIVLSAAAAFFYDCPEAFWVRAFSYMINSDDLPNVQVGGTAHVDWIEIYFYDPDRPDVCPGAYPGCYDDLAAFQEGVANAVNEISKKRLDTTPYETVKAIHDYVLLHSAYNYAALSGDSYYYGYVYSAAPLFVPRLNGLYVCEGYSKAMKILCNEFNIDCALVAGKGITSDVSGGPHMWCYVKLDGKWYAVDATWDDGHYYSDGRPYFLYNYFLVGSGTYVENNKKFSDNHINDGAVMYNWTGALVYPSLSRNAYDHYIVDTNPPTELTTLGAGIRLSEPYGIRFGIRLKQGGFPDGTQVPELGTLIIPKKGLGENEELTVTTPSVLKIKAEKFLSQDDTQITYTGVLIDIPTQGFDTEMVGRGYFIYIDSATGKEHIIYSEQKTRSLREVANLALADYESIENPDASQLAKIQKLKDIINKK